MDVAKELNLHFTMITQTRDVSLMRPFFVLGFTFHYDNTNSQVINQAIYQGTQFTFHYDNTNSKRGPLQANR